MSKAALEALRSAHSVLELALDGSDTRAIEAANEQFRAAIYRARAVGVWRDHPDLARSAADMLGRVEMALQRVKNLTRDTRERIAALEASRGRLGMTLYGRTGSTSP